MKYLVVIGLLMVGIQIGASQLSAPAVVLRGWKMSEYTSSMKQSIDKLSGNFDTELYQQLVDKLEDTTKFIEEVKTTFPKIIQKNPTLRNGFNEMSQDLANFREQLEASALVGELEVECKEMTAVVSSEEEVSISEDSYKNALKAAEECLDFLNSQKALLPDDKFKEFKDQLEGFKAKIERSGERHGFKEKTTATPEPKPLIQGRRMSLNVQPTTSIATQEPQATTSFDSSAAPTTTQTPPREQQSEQIKPAEIQQSTLERVSIPTVPAGNPVVPISTKPYNWKAWLGIGAGVVTVAATVIWYLWSPKNIIVSHS